MVALEVRGSSGLLQFILMGTWMCELYSLSNVGICLSVVSKHVVGSAVLSSVLWIIQKNCCWQKCSCWIFKMFFHCSEHNKQNFIHLLCLWVETQISADDPTVIIQQCLFYFPHIDIPSSCRMLCPGDTWAGVSSLSNGGPVIHDVSLLLAASPCSLLQHLLQLLLCSFMLCTASTASPPSCTPQTPWCSHSTQ